MFFLRMYSWIHRYEYSYIHKKMTKHPMWGPGTIAKLMQMTPISLWSMILITTFWIIVNQPTSNEDHWGFCIIITQFCQLVMKFFGINLGFLSTNLPPTCGGQPQELESEGAAWDSDSKARFGVGVGDMTATILILFLSTLST